jgi:polygalacturonase
MTSITTVKLFGDGVRDDTDAIQELLDKGGYVYIPHGTYLISHPLIIHSNTHLQLAQTAVLKLADNANCSILDNDGIYSGAMNENITIEGGIWDGNHGAQERQKIPNEGVAADENEDKLCNVQTYISNIYLVLMIRFVHTKNLQVKNLTFKNPTSFAIQIADSRYFTVENITLDYDLKKKNMDGIHVQGPAQFGYIHNIFGNANDDHVALCANGTTRSQITRGTIENVTIDGIYCDNGYTGVRLLSRGDPVRNIRISNIHGAFRYYAVSFTHHYPLREDMPVLIENVSVSNLFVSRYESAYPNDFSSADINAPLVWVEGGVNCKNIVLEKIFKNENVGGVSAPAVRISENANVENITIRDVYEKS